MPDNHPFSKNLSQISGATIGGDLPKGRSVCVGTLPLPSYGMITGAELLSVLPSLLHGSALRLSGGLRVGSSPNGREENDLAHGFLLHRPNTISGRSHQAGLLSYL